MRPVTLGSPPADTAGRLQWLVTAVQNLALASQEEPTQIYDSYSADAAYTTTRQVVTSAPTVANCAAVLATLVNDMQQRGVNRVSPT